MLPGLENAEFARYGVMHKNAYIKSPGLLDKYFRVRTKPTLIFCGQMTGVEGYIESAASGLLGGLGAAYTILQKSLPDFPNSTALGALAEYVSESVSPDFQPMHICFGIMSPPEEHIRKKSLRREYMAARALEQIDMIAEQLRKEDSHV